MSKITMDVIAAELGISKNTVSRALRGLSGVSDETRYKIMTYANENGYKIKTKDLSSLHVAMIYNKILNADSTFWPSVLSGITEYAADKGISLRIFTVDPANKTGFISSLRNEQNIDGLLIVNDLEQSILQQLEALKKPMVIADSFYNEFNCDYVNTDNHKGIYKAIAHLAANHHERIGFIGVNDSRISFQARYEAYLRHMKKFGFTVDEDYVWLGADWSDYEYFRRRMYLLQDRDKTPTAWICINDAILHTFVTVLNEFHYKIPDDFSVVGFDNVPLPLNLRHTTLNVSGKELGQQALRQLLSRIKDPAQPYKSIYLDASLVVRDSVRSI